VTVVVIRSSAVSDKVFEVQNTAGGSRLQVVQGGVDSRVQDSYGDAGTLEVRLCPYLVRADGFHILVPGRRHLTIGRHPVNVGEGSERFQGTVRYAHRHPIAELEATTNLSTGEPGEPVFVHAGIRQLNDDRLRGVTLAVGSRLPGKVGGEPQRARRCHGAVTAGAHGADTSQQPQHESNAPETGTSTPLTQPRQPGVAAPVACPILASPSLMHVHRQVPVDAKGASPLRPGRSSRPVVRLSVASSAAVRAEAPPSPQSACDCQKSSRDRREVLMHQPARCCSAGYPEAGAGRVEYPTFGASAGSKGLGAIQRTPGLRQPCSPSRPPSGQCTSRILIAEARFPGRRRTIDRGRAV